MSIEPTEYTHRLAEVRQHLDQWAVDGLLIGSNSNRRWLSGFTGSAGWLLVTADKALLGTDFRYWEQAINQAPAYELFRLVRSADSLAAFIAESGASRLGLEASHVTLSQFKELEAVPEVTWQPLNETVEPLRRIKSTAELALIRRAAQITDGVMAQVNGLAQSGMTERQLAWELEKRLREAGATAVAFPVIVASGPNSALAHHRPGDRQLQPGDAIVVDMGASVDGYNSDLTRTFYLGAEPNGRFREIYHLVLAAQTAALNGLRPGMTGQQVDALARDIIAGAGHGDHFGHGLGHGVGLDVHEGPSLSPRAGKEPLVPFMTTTVEPGVYLPGWGGIRIEDFVYIGDNGAERLSHCPKQPVISQAVD